jgi:hypothetical protein
MSIYVGVPRWRAAVSFAVLLVVWIVFVAAVAAIGWWLLTTVIHPLPYSDPEAASVSTSLG